MGIDANVALHMVLKGRGIYLYPIHEVAGNMDTEQSYAKVLERTQGAAGEYGGYSEGVTEREARA